MSRLSRTLNRLLADEEGQTPIENTGMACLVVMICLKFGPQICMKVVDTLVSFLWPIWDAL